MINKKTLIGLFALLIQIAIYLLLYTLFASFVYGPFTPAEASIMQFEWYAFIVIAIICNIFDPLLYIQILVWGIVIKYTYTNESPWICLSALVIGLLAIAANIAIRKNIKRGDPKERIKD